MNKYSLQLLSFVCIITCQRAACEQLHWLILFKFNVRWSVSSDHIVYHTGEAFRPCLKSELLSSNSFHESVQAFCVFYKQRINKHRPHVKDGSVLPFSPLSTPRGCRSNKVTATVTVRRTYTSLQQLRSCTRNPEDLQYPSFWLCVAGSDDIESATEHHHFDLCNLYMTSATVMILVLT